MAASTVTFAMLNPVRTRNSVNIKIPLSKVIKDFPDFKIEIRYGQGKPVQLRFKVGSGGFDIRADIDLTTGRFDGVSLQLQKIPLYNEIFYSVYGVIQTSNLASKI